jgi:hypothetical protein
VPERLPDLDFLALVRDALADLAPGATDGAELKGNSLTSPAGWAVGVLPPDPGAGHAYRLAAIPDVRVQPDVPMFLDTALSATGDPGHAAVAWAQTAGACLLELLDRRGRFARHAGPADDRGLPGRFLRPGRYLIESDVVGFGLDAAETGRLRDALRRANVLHRLAAHLTPDLRSPHFNGIRVFWGGPPGQVEAEVRVDGERHPAASAALAELGLPEPAVWTAVRFHALALPLAGGKPVYPAVRVDLPHVHDRHCGCGGELDPEHPGVDLPLPHPVAELPEAERAERIVQHTGAVLVADGLGSFLKVRLPVRLDDGRTLVYLAWVYLRNPDLAEVSRRARAGTLDGHRFEGVFGNAIAPWGEALLKAPVVVVGRPAGPNGGVGIPEIVESAQPLLREVLTGRWPADLARGAGS